MGGTVMGNDTASNFPGYWTAFLAALITQAPRPGKGPGKIDQETAIEWVKNQKALKKNLARTLCPAGQAAKSKFNLWKTTITIGSGPRTADGLIRALEGDECNISDWAYDLLYRRMGLLEIKEETEVNLVIVSVADLGFKYKATHRNIYWRAQELNLRLCPAEVGPQLRLQYLDQPLNECLLIGMKPMMAISGGVTCPAVFCVLHDEDGISLSARLAASTYLHDLDSRWVFCLNSKNNEPNLFNMLDKAEQDIEELNKRDVPGPEELRRPIV